VIWSAETNGPSGAFKHYEKSIALMSFKRETTMGTIHASPGEIVLLILNVCMIAVNVRGVWNALQMIKELRKRKLNGSLQFQAVDRVVVMSVLLLIQAILILPSMTGIFVEPPYTPGGPLPRQAQIRVFAFSVVSVLCAGLSYWLMQTRDILDSMPWVRKQKGVKGRE
jgi:hypothetical protein